MGIDLVSELCPLISSPMNPQFSVCSLALDLSCDPDP